VKIADQWKGVWSSGIDAAIRWNNNKAYFFKGDEYVFIYRVGLPQRRSLASRASGYT
jgi:hypothetical protein